MNVDTAPRRRFSAAALRRRRRELEMSQADLATKVGRRRNAVNRWEAQTRVPPEPVVPLIAAALGIPEADLYEDLPPAA